MCNVNIDTTQEPLSSALAAYIHTQNKSVDSVFTHKNPKPNIGSYVHKPKSTSGLHFLSCHFCLCAVGTVT